MKSLKNTNRQEAENQVDFTLLLGGKKERARQVLAEMGPAVFNGGLSTFLAFILVAFSDSYVFITFFKVSLTLEAAFLHGLQDLHPRGFQRLICLHHLLQGKSNFIGSLLAFILAAFSDSYVFITFFKVSLNLQAAFLHGLQALHPRGFQ
jgi:hypothetical protein